MNIKKAYEELINEVNCAKIKRKLSILLENMVHFLTLLRKVRVACDDNSSKFPSSVYEFSNYCVPRGSSTNLSNS